MLALIVLIVPLGLASPWVINLTRRHLRQVKQPYQRNGKADPTPRATPSQAEIDRKFDDIVRGCDQK